MTFDNHYITAELEFRDRERRRQELPTIFPLDEKESSIVVDFKSLRLLRKELKILGGNVLS